MDTAIETKLTSTPFRRDPEEITPWSETCGAIRCLIEESDLAAAEVHHVKIQDAKLHYHKKTDEIYYIIDGEGNITSGQITTMVIKSGPTNGYYIFTGYIPCLQSGHCGFTICVLPKNNDLVDKYDSGLIVWDDTTSKDKKIVATK